MSHDIFLIIQYTILPSVYCDSDNVKTHSVSSNLASMHIIQSFPFNCEVYSQSNLPVLLSDRFQILIYFLFQPL